MGIRTERSGRAGRTTRRRFWLVAASVFVVALLLTAKFRTPIADRFNLMLAERAIAAGRLDEAEGRLEILVEKHPARAWPRFLAARVARERGRITEAEERLQRAIDLGLSIELARPEHTLLREATVRDYDAGEKSVVSGDSILRK